MLRSCHFPPLVFSFNKDKLEVLSFIPVIILTIAASPTKDVVIAGQKKLWLQSPRYWRHKDAAVDVREDWLKDLFNSRARVGGDRV